MQRDGRGVGAARAGLAGGDPRPRMDLGVGAARTGLVGALLAARWSQRERSSYKHPKSQRERSSYKHPKTPPLRGFSYLIH